MTCIRIRTIFVALAALSFAPFEIAQTTPLQSCANIMPLGDSITLGVNGGYRNDLYSGLQQNNCGVSYVGTLFDPYTRVSDKDHEGHPGFTIGDIASSVNGWLAATQPDIVTLIAGSNDIAWWTVETAEQIGARHNALIDQIQRARPDVWILVASIPPQSSVLVPPISIDRAVLTAEFNEVVRRNVGARVAAGQRVRFVDVNAALTTADLYDGIHPTEAAHGAVAQKFLEAIRAALGSASTPASAPPSPTPLPMPPPPQASTPPSPATGATSPTSSVSSQNQSGGAIGFALDIWLIGLALRRSRRLSLWRGYIDQRGSTTPDSHTVHPFSTRLDTHLSGVRW
jgi:lysophospholipase L1-like esterase